MPDWYDARLILDPAEPLEESVRQLPGRWAVYLMLDADRRPVQLLSVKNLRASVRRRLAEADDRPTPRIPYARFIREVRYCRVDSPLESELVYLRAAEQSFPENYRSIVPHRPPWYVHIDPAEPFPRWQKTQDATLSCGGLYGPMLEKSHAERLVEKIEDLFDLCRYHNILVQSPRGLPCVYKQMGRCPAPCDGSVSMQQYRTLIEWSVRVMIDPEEEVTHQIHRMHDAARVRKFELAAKIKTFADELNNLRGGEWQFARPLSDFRFLSVQPGPGKSRCKVFVLTPTRVECVVCLLSQPGELLAWSRDIRDLTQPAEAAPDEKQAERLRIAARHLMSKKPVGQFIHGDALSDAAIADAFARLSRRKDVVEDDEGLDEGVVTEMK